MLGREDVTAWTAVGTAFAALLVLLAIWLLARWRRASERRFEAVQASATRAEELLSELTENLERVQTESHTVREQGERAEREAGRLRVLGELGTTLDLETVAHRALEQAAGGNRIRRAMAVLGHDVEDPFTASFGLSPAESERELVSLPPGANDARAVTIRYRYTTEEAENDAFRLRSARRAARGGWRPDHRPSAWSGPSPKTPRLPINHLGFRAVEPWSYDYAGRIDEHVVESDALRDNPLGDPASRPLWVYVPPGYDDEPDRHYPSVYVLQGYTGQIEMWRNRTPFRQPFPATADAAIATGDIPPAVVVYVDAWTAYGGSQYVDSPGTGRYHTYLCDEIVPFVDERYRILDAPEHRGVSGKSSGGFGALITPMLRPDLFGGLASHAGDSLYEHCYIQDFGRCVRALRDEYEGSYERFWADFRSRPPMSKESDNSLVMIYGVAAAFSAAEDGTVQLPFDLESGRLVSEVWQRWLDWDPVRMIPRYADALRGLEAVYLDAGKRDEWYLDLGAVAVKRELEAIGVTDVFLELFDATHMGIDYRYPTGLRYLVERLSP